MEKTYPTAILYRQKSRGKITISLENVSVLGRLGYQIGIQRLDKETETMCRVNDTFHRQQV